MSNKKARVAVNEEDKELVLSAVESIRSVLKEIEAIQKSSIYINFDFTSRRMIDAQANLISRLNDSQRHFQKQLDAVSAEADRCRAEAQIWQDMQTVILDNPTVMSEWQRFCMFLKMVVGDEDISAAAEEIRNANAE